MAAFGLYESPDDTAQIDAQLAEIRNQRQKQANDTHFAQNTMLPQIVSQFQTSISEAQTHVADSFNMADDQMKKFSDQMSGADDEANQLADAHQQAVQNFQDQADKFEPEPPPLQSTDAGQQDLTMGQMQPASDTSMAAQQPTDYRQAAIQAAQQAGIDPNMFSAQIEQESNFNPQAKSPAGATGIAQFMPQTAQGLGIDPNDPLASLSGAAQLMKKHLDSYGGDYSKALAAYNAGPGAVAQYGGVPPYQETQNYVSTITSKAAAAKAAATQAHSGVDTADNPNVAQATAAALGAGADPAWVQRAQSHLGENAYIGLCQEFVENILGKDGVFPTASDAWNSYSKNGQAVNGLDGVKDGDLIYFSDPSNAAGHTGVVTGVDKNGQPLFDSATNSGIRQYGVSDWEKLTGQTALGYVPIDGSTDLSQSNTYVSPRTGAATPTTPQNEDVTNMLPTWLQKPLKGVGSFFSNIGSSLAPGADDAANSLHMALTGKPLDQNALDAAMTAQKDPGQTLKNLSALGSSAIAGPLGAQYAASNWQGDPMADLVNQGKNPLNPLAWGEYISNELLNSATQIVTGDKEKKFADTGLGKFPVAGGLIEQAADPVQDLLMFATGGLGKLGTAGKLAEDVTTGLIKASDVVNPGLHAAGRVAEGGIWGGLSAENSASQPGANPATTLISGIIGGASPLLLHTIMTKIMGGHPAEIIDKIATAQNIAPEQVTDDVSHSMAESLVQASGVPNTPETDIVQQVANKVKEAVGYKLSRDPETGDFVRTGRETGTTDTIPADMTGGATADIFMKPGDKVVYRGDKQPLEGDRLDPNRFAKDSMYGPGAYFTDNPTVANGYAIPPNHPTTKPDITLSDFVDSVHKLADTARSRGLDTLADRIDNGVTGNIGKEALENPTKQIGDPRNSIYEFVTMHIPQSLPEDPGWAAVMKNWEAEHWNAGANTRAAIIPGHLNILDTTKDASPSFLDSVRTSLNDLQRQKFDELISSDAYKLSKGNTVSNDEIYHSLVDAIKADLEHGYPKGQPTYPIADNNTALKETNLLLKHLGYDGIRYSGGKIMPLTDDAGNSITHNAYNIFPESLHKIKNAFTGFAGGSEDAAEEAAAKDSLAKTSLKDSLKDLSGRLSPIAKVIVQKMNPDTFAELHEAMAKYVSGDATEEETAAIASKVFGGEITPQLLHADGGVLAAVDEVNTYRIGAEALRGDLAGTQKAIDEAARLNIPSPATGDVKEGFTRLFRGHKTDTTPGNVFGTSIEAANNYGNVHYIDVPTDVLEPMRKTATTFTLPKELANQAVPMTQQKLMQSARAEVRGTAAAEQKAEKAKRIDAAGMKLIADTFRLNAPQDVQNAVMKSLITPSNVASGLGTVAGATYGATQDPNDDMKAKIFKALAYGVIGGQVGHIAAGGPVKDIGGRALNTWIGNLLGAGTVELKAASDSTGIIVGPVIRSMTAGMHGQFSAMGPILKAGYGQLMSGDQELPIALAHRLMNTHAGAFVGFAQLAHELDPRYVFRGQGLEELAAGERPSNVSYKLLDRALNGDAAAKAELQGKLNLTTDTPGYGQFISSVPTRMLRGITFFARSVMTAQELAMNEALVSKGYKGRTAKEIQESVDNLLLSNTRTRMGAISRVMYDFTGALVNSPVGETGRVLAPFRLIPANMLGQIMDYVPGLGLVNLMPGRGGAQADASTVLAHQLLGTAGLLGAAFAFGGNVHGFGPTESKERSTWLAAGNVPWSVKIGDHWMAMRQIPAAMQGPLRVLGAADDYQSFNGQGNLPMTIVKEFGGALQDHEFFPRWLSVIDATLSGTDPTKAFEEAAASQVGSIVPNTIAAGKQSQEQYRGDVLEKGADFPTLVKNALANRAPGFDVNPKLSPAGQPVPNQNYGANAFLGSYKPLSPHPDAVTQAYTEANPRPDELAQMQNEPPERRVSPMGIPPVPKNVTLPGGNLVPMTPDEIRTFEQLRGQQLDTMVQAVWPSIQDQPVIVRQAVLRKLETAANRYANSLLVSQIAQNGDLFDRAQQANLDTANRASF